jgi:hypothetical protein
MVEEPSNARYKISNPYVELFTEKFSNAVE